MNRKIIDKSELGTIKTASVNRPSGEAVPIPTMINRLQKLANRAMLLGNGAKSKVKIVFLTLDGIREVHTTVWAATKDYILLKGGRFIPIDAIIDIHE